MNVHAFTSITSNYIPKARVLAASLKAQHPQWKFHVVLSDEPPPGDWLACPQFDSVIRADTLPIERFRAWAFGHTIVELCTAVKGPALREIGRRFAAEAVMYFDPDICVAGRLDDLTARLEAGASVLLTPHLTEAEPTPRGIEDNEIAALKHGVYNLGFVAVRMDANGQRFADWWAERLLGWCEDFIPGGLFTDQRWADLAPALFDGVHIVRSPRYNVATWNISNRRVEGEPPAALRVNGEPMGFYHFSGLDKGALATMLEIYGRQSPAVQQFLAWYLRRCDEEGQGAIGETPWAMGRYADGTPVAREHRLLYRLRADLQQAFPDPYAVGENGGYLAWFRANAAQEIPTSYAFLQRRPPEGEALQAALGAVRELDLIRRSRAYGFALRISRIYRRIRRIAPAG